METTTVGDDDATQELLAGTAGTFVPRTAVDINGTTTTSSGNSGGTWKDGDTEEVFLWLPLVFVILFALIIVALIIASRFSFSCCLRHGSRGRSSDGEWRAIFFPFLFLVVKHAPSGEGAALLWLFYVCWAGLD